MEHWFCAIGKNINPAKHINVYISIQISSHTPVDTQIFIFILQVLNKYFTAAYPILGTAQVWVFTAN